jgi:hypothetical protein
MAQVSAEIQKLKEEFNLSPNDVWDCHGTWVMLHRACEKVASKMGIVFDEPKVLNVSGESIAILVTGRIGDDSAWSVGEASPKNNKNAYPWAMAEKRAKDRVILKLARFSEAGVYSDIEADDFKSSRDNNDQGQLVEIITGAQCETLTKLIIDTNSDEDKFLRYYKAITINQFPADKYDNAIKALESKL